MPIDYRKLRNITAIEMISALSRDGFYLRSQKGSHQRYCHPDGRKVTVSFHGSSDTFPYLLNREFNRGARRGRREELLCVLRDLCGEKSDLMVAQKRPQLI